MFFPRYVLFSVFLLLITFFSGCTKQNNPLPVEVIETAKVAVLPQVCHQATCRTVEIADEPEEQKQGLMNITNMDEDKGVLFVFDKIAAWPFWMKDTLIPLDIIRLDDAGEIVYLSRNTPPCDLGDSCPGYGPKTPDARYVLELNAGQAEKYDISLGSVFMLPE